MGISIAIHPGMCFIPGQGTPPLPASFCYPDVTPHSTLAHGWDTMALTDLAIRKLKPPATGRLERYDRLIPGFGVRITDKGAKSYVFVYPHGGRRRRYTIGRVGEISL